MEHNINTINNDQQYLFRLIKNQKKIRPATVNNLILVGLSTIRFFIEIPHKKIKTKNIKLAIKLQILALNIGKSSSMY